MSEIVAPPKIAGSFSAGVSPEEARGLALRLGSGTGISLFGKLGGRLAYAVGQILIARLLGPSEFGLYAVGWTIVRLAGVVAPAGLDQSVVRYGAHYYGRNPGKFKSVLLTCLGLGSLCGIVVGIAIWFGAPWLGTRAFHKPELTSILRVFAISIPLTSVAAIASAATRITQRMKFSALIEDVSQQGSNLLLVILVFLAGGGLGGVVGATVVSSGVSLVVGLIIARNLFRRELASDILSTSAHAEIMRFSPTALLAGVFGMLLLWIDRLVLAHFRPASEVGLYQAASQIAIIFEILLSAVCMTIGPILVSLHSTRNYKQIEELYRVSIKWLLYFSIPLFLFFGVVAKNFMIVVFGARYAGAWTPLVILLGGQFVNVITGTTGLLLVMTDRERSWLIFSMVAFFLNLGLAIVLIQGYGLVGAAASTAISTALLSIMSYTWIRHSMKISLYDRRFAKILIAAMASIVLTVSGRELIHAIPVVQVVLDAVIATGAFGATLWILDFDPEDKELLALLYSRLVNITPVREPCCSTD